MLKNRLVSPILASALVLACTREAVADGLIATYESLFNDHVDITVPGYSGGTNLQLDFPLLVRVSPSSPAGFSYSRVDPNGKDIRFLYCMTNNGIETIQAVPYEVDNWDTNGVSTLWVKVPRLQAISANVSLRLKMYWAPDDPDALPANRASEVWDAYTAVWHMNSTVESTANGIATVAGPAVRAGAGAIGLALGTRATTASGPILAAPKGTPIDNVTTGAYTVTGWVKINSAAAGSSWFYTRRATPEDDAYGVEFQPSGAGLKTWIHTDGANVDKSTKTLDFGDWVHLAVVHSGQPGKHTVYKNGAAFYEPTNATREDKNGTLGFALGGLIGDTSEGTLNGDLDEVRIYPGALKPARLKTEYEQATVDGYTTFGPVFSTGKPVYVKEPDPISGDDEPGTVADYAPDDYAGRATFIPEGVVAGTTLTNFVTLIKVWEGSPVDFVPSALPFGSEDVRFFNEKGEVLASEVDLWDANGESFFWVKVPELTRSTRITMCWGLREGRALPPYQPSEVWTDYAGVWHMMDEHDSTANDAKGQFGTNTVLRFDGRIGKATGTKKYGRAGAILDVEATPAIEALTNGPFTASGWMFLNREKVRAGYLFSRASETDPAWGAQFCGGDDGDISRIAVHAGVASSTNNVTFIHSSWVRFDIVYSGASLALYLNGEKKSESYLQRMVMGGTSGKLAIGGLVSNVEGILGANTLDGYIDEFRLRPGVQSQTEIAAEFDQCDSESFLGSTSATWDETAILQNRWRRFPSMSIVSWKEGDEPATVDVGEPWYGFSSVRYVNRVSGETYEELPTEVGDYRAVFTVSQNGRYSSLTYTIDFRIRIYKPSHDLGDGDDRALLLNDDASVAEGKVEIQAYNNTVETLDLPYWWHDVDTGFDYTSTSPYYNFCGGLRHTYYAADDRRLWDLIDVRYGNTYNNADDVFSRTGDWEEWEDGLAPEMNYLPWNPAGGRLVDLAGGQAEGWHEFAAQAVLCNTLKASINSSLYTNGIGTIYFDAVNSHIDDAAGGFYKLVVEIATNALDRASGRPAGLPTDRAIEATYNTWDADGKPITVVHDPYRFADWKPVTLHVREVNGAGMVDRGTTESLVLDLRGGGSYTNFYRVYAPVNFVGPARFRIRRTAINPDYTIRTDIHSLILVDNVICSRPTDRVRVEPRGNYDPKKVKRETSGYEGAFKPAYPAVNDTAVYARAVAHTLSGQKPPSGMISSVTMHYRWRYLDQQSTEWMMTDLDPTTLVGNRPIVWQGLSGDIEYWYEVNQSGKFYRYADYSGLGLGLDGYSEEIASVTNRADTYETHGKDWYTRIRYGKSTYGAVKLFVRLGDTAPVQEVEMSVARDQVWRGCLQTTNALPNGILFRLEGHDKQDDLLEDFQYNTNYWYYAETAQGVPLSGTVSVGTPDNWGRVPCDAATGHLMFQLDESTRAITVVHADWQDFNGWNDADRPYFSGSSTDDITKKGTSATRREYLRDYNGWDEDLATNLFWNESFTPSTFSGYDFYVPFESDTSPNGFAVGEGMWVRGAYADTSLLAGMSLQMKGQGRGWIQMTNPAVKPRGLEAVKFNARIAQGVSPDQFAYYGEGGRLNNYTFITRAAFDLNGNSNFTGNASLSLAAFLRPNSGCYEARWEQLGGDLENGSGTILGPTPRSQALSLYRWRYSGTAWRSELLISATNSGAVCSWNDSVAPRAIPATYSITNNLMPFMIGAYDNADLDYTVVIAAVRIDGGRDAEENVRGGVTANATLSSISSAGWLYIVFRDESADRLKRGTYGLLSANCEGVFVRPQYHGRIASWMEADKTKTLATQIQPNGGSGAKSAIFDMKVVTNCVADIVNEFWVDNPGREGAFYDTPYDNYNGFRAQVVTQTVDVYTAPLGTTSWKLAGSRMLTGFGTPGVLQDSHFNFWSTEDSSVRIRAGGKVSSAACTDVVVDNIQISQWRGNDWLGSTETEQAQGGITNFVYTSGWITDGALQLSPKRTPLNQPCSLRVPFCDGKGTARAMRGIGLGFLSFEYRNAQKNARLLVQIATNGISTLNLLDYTLDPGKGALNWTTITNWNFSSMTETERKGGVLYCAPGLHGVTGTMRIIVDPDLVDAVKDETDPEFFGSVEIVSAFFRDEPPLDPGCWWGWNLRTLGDRWDTEQRMYLPDNPYRSLNPSLDEVGRSLALNNSITEDCDPKEIARVPNPFREHMPFLQTPTFTSNIVGEISFKARKYSLYRGTQLAEVALYGTRETNVGDLKDDEWEHLNTFIVSNTTYETYTFKTDPGEGYRAFRLAVTGVDGVTYPGPDPICGDEPVRVLIDDVLVSEAVRARLAFRRVGAFRHDLKLTTFVPNVPSPEEQPIIEEGWGVQAEVYAAMLGEEIDLSTPPRVRLHYFTGIYPWGYQNWKNLAKAQSAWLSAATDTNLIYRSSYVDSPDAVIPMATTPNTVVQYMLEVIYTVINSETGGLVPATNWLEVADWETPYWYRPVNYNTNPNYGKGQRANFAAFCILDEIAPGWAWINEANIYGVDSSNKNSDDNRQFIEIAKPAEYDLNDWQLRMLCYRSGNTDPPTATITTNTIAVFGTGNVAKSKTTKHMADNMTFMVVGCPASDGQTLFRSSVDDAKDETLDGTWQFATTDTTHLKQGGTVGYYSPIGIQLVRKSGVVEHEIVIIGTNKNASSPYMRVRYEPTNLVNRLNATDSTGRYFYAGSDNGGAANSLGVFDSRGESAVHWNNTMKLTPGRINEHQAIDPDHPTPEGEMVMVFANVDTAFGHIVQTVGAGTNTTASQIVAIKRGSEGGLNIVYNTDPWYELGTVTETENKSPRIPIVATNALRTYTVNVAKGAQRNVTVTASAAVAKKLRDFGVDEHNRYTPAILDWLEKHTDLYGNEFYDWESGEIYLAKFIGLSGTITNDMSLTQMYWLDIDPTVSNMFFRAGMVRPPSESVLVRPTYTADEPQAITNLRMGVYMAISNGNENVETHMNGKDVWAPYVLRGLGLGETSKDYSLTTGAAWTSVTFKVTGYLNNGLNDIKDAATWIPLRYFVFHEDSFDSHFESEIDVADPFTTSSIAYHYGWYDWAQKHGRPSVFFGWNIDQRLVPVTAEVLAPTNRIHTLP